ncbi:MAG: RHS repeat protein, partial [candidate division Zixibacteria bacterium]|nr:RHS repeat protein [candidate division Zixibacteria bacterium]
EYFRNDLDLSVKIPGGTLEIRRVYYDGQWYLGPGHTSMAHPTVSDTYEYSFGDGTTTMVLREGILYKREGKVKFVGTNSPGSELPMCDYIFIGGTSFQSKWGVYDPDRWEDKKGNWKTYRNEHVLSIGWRNKTYATMIFEGDDKPVGVADGYGNQVIWYEYNDDGQISAIKDAAGRRVEYEYEERRLTLVRDPLGHETRFENTLLSEKPRLTEFMEGTEMYAEPPPSSNDPSPVNCPLDGAWSGGANTLSGILPQELNSIYRVIHPDGGETLIGRKGREVRGMADGGGRGYGFSYNFDKRKKEYYAMITGPHPDYIREMWYDEDGVTKRMDINGKTVKKVTRDNGNNIIIKDGNGNLIHKEYDAWDNLTRMINEDGSMIINQYDSQTQQLTLSQNERHVSTLYEYDGDGNMTRMIEAADKPEERTTEFTHDAYGNVLTITRVGDAVTPDTVTTITYDSFGNMDSITDPEGNTRHFTHDIMGNILTKKDPRGMMWTYERDDLGRLKRIIDPLNHVTIMEYDPKGRKIQKIDPEGHESTFGYNEHGDLETSVDGEGNETIFKFNLYGHLYQTIDAEGKRDWKRYDEKGRIVEHFDDAYNFTKMEYGAGSGCSSCVGSNFDKLSRINYPTFSKRFYYDKRGRKIEEQDILNGAGVYSTQYSYDATGNLWKVIDKNSKETVYFHDSLNRLTKVVDAMKGETVYTYDNRGNLLSLGDANGNTTLFEYDRNNRLTKEIRPMGKEITYAYDSSGNLIEMIDPKDQKTQYVYDDANRLINIHYYSNDALTNAVKSVFLTYDKVGNLASYNDGATMGLYTYDSAKRKISETVNYGPFSLTYDYTYYKNGLMKTFTGSDDVTYQYTYDEANRLTGIYIPGMGYLTYSDYDWNRPSSIILPGGATRKLTYDPLMRINSIKVKGPGQNELMNYQYTYDKMDNIMSKDTEHGRYIYGYDDLYRLTNVSHLTQDDEEFTYDNVGNRLTSEDTDGNWVYNENNELIGYDNVNYVYDENGNMTEKIVNGAITKYFYNIEDRLVRVEDGSGDVIATYYYDPFGRRLWKDVNFGKIFFHYADEGLIGEYDRVGNEIKAYIYKPGSKWTSDPLIIKDENEFYFYQNDHLGTPQILLDINGDDIWNSQYKSFGDGDVQGGGNMLRFGGQYFDSETGLHYNYHRYYDPKTGRYLRSDPIGLKGGINLYTYSLNNPLIYLDMYGLSSDYVPPTILALPNCNSDEYEMCRKSCSQIDRSVRHCKRQAVGAGAFVYCIPDYREEIVGEQEKTTPRFGQKEFDLHLCLAEGAIRLCDNPFLLKLWNFGCYLTAFAAGASGD